MFESFNLDNFLSFTVLAAVYFILKELAKITSLLSQVLSNLPTRSQLERILEQVGYIKWNTAKPVELSDEEKDFEKERPYYRALAEADRLEKLKTKSNQPEGKDYTDGFLTKPTLEDYDYDTEKYEEALTGWLERKHQSVDAKIN
jgi:hypothetical protein